MAIFISHRLVDTGKAEKLAVDLESHGYAVKLDTREVLAGDSITEWMNDALRDVDALILCLSTAGVDSPWTRREWLATLARILNGENILFLPVRLTGGTPPPIVADLKYADAVADWQQAIDDLVAALKRHFK